MPLSKPGLAWCQLNSKQTTSVKFEPKNTNIFFQDTFKIGTRQYKFMPQAVKKNNGLVVSNYDKKQLGPQNVHENDVLHKTIKSAWNWHCFVGLPLDL